MKSIGAFFVSMWGKLWRRRNLIFLTFIISIFGGFPGVVNLRDWINDKPKFMFYAETMQNGMITMAGRGSKVWVQLNGAIYNAGRQPLFPMHYELVIKFSDGVDTGIAMGGSLYTFDSTVFSGPNQSGFQAKADKDAKDLYKCERVNPDDAAFGSMVFIFSDITADFAHPKSIRLLCYDILDEKRSYPIELPGRTLGYPTYYPRTGMFFEKQK